MGRSPRIGRLSEHCDARSWDEDASVRPDRRRARRRFGTGPWQDEKTKTAPAPAPGVVNVKKDLKSRASYAIGMEFARNIKPTATELDLDIDALLLGIRTTLTDGKSALTEAELDQTMQEFRKQIIALREKKVQERPPPTSRSRPPRTRRTATPSSPPTRPSPA